MRPLQAATAAQAGQCDPAPARQPTHRGRYLFLDELEETVNASLWLLTAGLLTAPGQAPCVQCAQCAQCQNMNAPAPTAQVVYVTTDHPHGLIQTLRDRLHHASTPSGVQMMPIQTMNGQIVTTQMVPVSGVIRPVAMVQPVVASSSYTSAAEPPRAEIVPAAVEQLNLEVKKPFQAKIGNADDYSWITGQLFYVHVDGGQWVLRFASVGQEDKYGGSVVLAGADMKNYREGDLVSVNGEILNQGRASRHLGGPLYRADSITMIERCDSK